MYRVSYYLDNQPVPHATYHQRHDAKVAAFLLYQTYGLHTDVMDERTGEIISIFAPNEILWSLPKNPS